MHPKRIVLFFGLMAIATSQQTTDAPEVVPSVYDPTFVIETTITLPGPSGIGTVFDCFIEAEGDDHLEEFEFECSSVSNITFPTSTAPSRASAQQALPMSVLEARMQRKFGVKARQDDGSLLAAATTLPGTCEACYTVTVTSTSYAGGIPESCSPLPTPPPAKNGILPTLAVPAAQITAMSIVAGMLSHEVAAAAPPQSAANLIPIFVSVLTANLTLPTASGVPPFGNNGVSNGTVAAPTLGATVSSGILSPPASQAKSIGHSIAVGILANLLAAAGVAYVLV